MKRPGRWFAAGVIVTVLGLSGAMIASALSGTPEIDRASSRFQLSGKLTPVRCLGEDSTAYITYSGTWSGGATQVLPDTTDYAPLSGPAKVTGIKWTINTKTLRGVLTGMISVSRTTATGTVVVYSGPLTLVTQGNPAAATAPVLARGWISASVKLPDDGVAGTAPEDFVIANTEFKISGNGSSVIAQFGDAAGSFGIADYSAVTNVAPIAADGTC